MDKKSWWRSIPQNFFIGMLFFLSIGIVVYIYPREGKFKYEYQKGKPWMSDVLIAPWDFPIYKSQSEITRETDSLQVKFKSFFKQDSTVFKTQVDNFNKYYDELKVTISNSGIILPDRDYLFIRDWLDGILETIYNQGVLEFNDMTEQLRTQDKSILLIKGNVADEKSVSQLLSPKDAYQLFENERVKFIQDLEGQKSTQFFNFVSEVSISDFVKPNIFFNEEVTNARRASLVSEISTTRGLIQAGELIISRGEIVNDYTFRILESIRYEYGTKVGLYNVWLLIVGNLLIVSACYLILYLFLYNFRRELLDSFQKTLFIIILILSFVVVTRIVSMVPELSIYLIPFAIIPVIIRTFYDPRLALFILLVTLMITGFLVPNSFEFVFLNFLGGVVVIFTLTNTYRRGKLFFSATMVFLTLSLVYFGIAAIQERDISSIDYFTFAWFAGNAGLILISYPLIFIFEKMFGFLSDATLFELTDTNQPLLRRLAEEAPGSFQHSMQVANLAEDAARTIGANPLLIRAGALYHDIGKVGDAEYFTENQSDSFNPHDSRDPVDSAKLIIRHIEVGVELARKEKLPEQIIDFIRTHQGTTKTYYFYRKFKEKYPGVDVDPSIFSYPGPKPFTVETALLMMVDSVEAASRSLQEYSEETIRNLVETIIDHQMQEDQFTEAPITYKNITVVKDALVKRLSTIYHARIAYPKKEEEQ
jgi:hypothetical protein